MGIYNLYLTVRVWNIMFKLLSKLAWQLCCYSIKQTVLDSHMNLLASCYARNPLNPNHVIRIDLSARGRVDGFRIGCYDLNVLSYTRLRHEHTTTPHYGNVTCTSQRIAIISIGRITFRRCRSISPHSCALILYWMWKMHNTFVRTRRNTVRQIALILDIEN